MKHYQIFRCSGLGFSEELQVVFTGDVLQQRLSGVAVCLPMLLWTRQEWRLDDTPSSAQIFQCCNMLYDVPCAFLSAPSEGQSFSPSSSQPPALCICSVSMLASENQDRKTLTLMVISNLHNYNYISGFLQLF